MLNSIVSRLLSLADLAEGAALRSPWVRWCVLWSAWQADAIVRDFVAGSAWNPGGRLWSPSLPSVRYGTEPADAQDLAASLRALALVVQAMAAQLRRLSFWQQGQASDEAGHDSRMHRDALKCRPGAMFSPVEFRDTS